MVAVALGAASWMACVGDDPAASSSGGAAVGDRLGACFPDGKCKEGLECRLPERICLTPGEPVPPDAGRDASGGGGDGGLDGSATDGNADSSGDGGACTLSQQASSPGPYCDATKCQNGLGCCATAASTVSCTDATACSNNGGQFFACDGKGSCGAANCCLLITGGGSTGAACGQKLVGTATSCTGNPCAAQQMITVCTTASDCGGVTCEPVEVELAPNRIVVWGRCVN